MKKVIVDFTPKTRGYKEIRLTIMSDMFKNENKEILSVQFAALDDEGHCLIEFATDAREFVNLICRETIDGLTRFSPIDKLEIVKGITMNDYCKDEIERFTDDFEVFLMNLKKKIDEQLEDITV